MKTFALTELLGMPLIAWGGLTTLITFFLAASIAYMNLHGNHRIPFKWHKRVAGVALLFAILHGILGLSLFLFD